ncbi:MAG: isochorismatase family cysteine hydrolase [Candidatus Woesearchaeota archaeon]
MTTALILIDFQNEWMDKESDYYVGELLELIANTNKLLAHARKNKWKIIWTRHEEPESEGAFKPGTEGVKLMSQLDISADDTIIVKNIISPFLNNSLDEELDGIENVVVSGILTNLCVRMTVEESYDRGLNITLVKDCCATFDEETHEFTLKDLKATREEIDIKSVSELV